MNDGIHWLDGLIFVALCFSAYMAFKFFEAHHALKELEKLEQRWRDNEPYDWKEDGL